jgi:hypothetical protein
LSRVESRTIIAAMESIRNDPPDLIVMEDASLRTWFGDTGRERAQGAGSIKRDCSIWREFAAFYSIPMEVRRPQKGATKWSAEKFAQLTGWTGRTNEHGRDAAMLVFRR